MESVTTATLSLFKAQSAASRLVANTDINYTFFAGAGYMTVMNISADVVSWVN